MHAHATSRFAVLLALCVAPSIRGQVGPPAGDGEIVGVTVPAPALAGNLLGDPAEQPAAIYLPPGYRESTRRYPVLYLLHGIGDSPDVWVEGAYQGMEIRATLDSLIGADAIQPMIVVMPNGTNRYVGSYYEDSPVSGDWRTFIARDLVEYVDAHYRTIAHAESRGIAGHSMGGYGSIVVAMHHPGLVSAVWAMNPCCLAMVEDLEFENPAVRGALRIETLEDFDAALAARDFYPVAVIALASVFSPRPDLPPLYVDLPFREEDDRLVPAEPAYSRWRAAVPAARARAHREALAGLRALRVDTAFTDEFGHIPPAARMFADTLAVLEVPHVFEMYEGDHRNRIRERVTELVLPWFSRLLEGEAEPH